LSTSTSDTARPTTARRSRRPTARTHLSAAVRYGLVALAAVAVLAAVFAANTPSGQATASSPSGYAFEVGDPSTGPAPGFELPAATGGTVALADYAGQDVLLYFQEGLMCQPCWDQLTDIEARWDGFAELGIDGIVSITGDPLDALAQKVALEGIDAPVLSDRGLEASRTYDAQAYGMMGGSTNGHTFVLVGSDGEIRWRADYGGAPDYTMYLPVDSLLADLRAGLDGGAAG
jgi:peroxiredoxin